ncbi:MAG: hypothetical protein H7293_09555 [Candidatus Saccharibacteria bacterium]|nr:hypothetical protein [Rhodoferax sp.]
MLEFIGEDCSFAHHIRIEYFDSASGVLGAFESSIDAPEWIPSGCCTAAYLPGQALFHVPRGRSDWLYEPWRNNCDVKKEDKSKPAVKGGKRVGSGRKSIDTDGTIVTTVRLTAKQKATLDMLGGGAWLRLQLDLLID